MYNISPLLSNTWLFSLLIADGLGYGLHHLQLLRIGQVPGVRGVPQNVGSDVNVGPKNVNVSNIFILVQLTNGPTKLECLSLASLSSIV